MENIQALLEAIETEKDVIESIYADEGVIVSPPKISDKHTDQVTMVLKFQPKTGQDEARVCVIIQAKFDFTFDVNYFESYLCPIVSIRSPKI
jgi:hypothetical protein